MFFGQDRIWTNLLGYVLAGIAAGLVWLTWKDSHVWMHRHVIPASAIPWIIAATGGIAVLVGRVYGYQGWLIGTLVALLGIAVATTCFSNGKVAPQSAVPELRPLGAAALLLYAIYLLHVEVVTLEVGTSTEVELKWPWNKESR